MLRKQFPLRPAAANTIHRSQADTETRVVVNFDTRRTIPHIHYVGLSRVTTLDGLFITDLCENKIAVSCDVQTEMDRLRGEWQLFLSVTPVNNAYQISFKMCFLNVRSLHTQIEDVCKDLNYSATGVNIFSETRFGQFDSDNLYLIKGEQYSLFRNDAPSRHSQNTRPFGGTTVYSRLDYYPGYPYCSNRNDVEIAILRFMMIPHVTIVAIYRSPSVSIRETCDAIKETLYSLPTQFNVFIGDFNVNWFSDSQRTPLYNFFVRGNGYRQLVSCSNRITILLSTIYTLTYQRYKHAFKY